MYPMVDESAQTGRSTVRVETTASKELPALAEAKAKLQEVAVAGGRPGR
jgi:hypothetical protein